MPLRVLIDSGNYFADNSNVGDAVVFGVAAHRLRRLWPNCDLQWITANPASLQKICPDATPLVVRSPRSIPLACRMPNEPTQAVNYAQRLSRAARRMGGSNEVASPGWDRTAACSDPAILEALLESDVVAVVGGGIFTRNFAEHARGILDTLDHAVRLGKPTAILSTGFEDFQHFAFNAQALRVLPQIDLIACRESLLSPGVLTQYGVPATNIATTGDDAIEPAYLARPSVLGDGIGLCLRRADYAGMGARESSELARLMPRLRNALPGPWLPVPISLHGPSDPEGIRELMAAAGIDSDGGSSLRTPTEVIATAGRCRLVITGSYHSAVFALSQGVPAIGISNSPHYFAKYSGLKHEFGAGFEFVCWDDPRAAERLLALAAELWAAAPSLRAGLQSAARRQVDAGWRAYQRLADRVDQIHTRDSNMSLLSSARQAVSRSWHSWISDSPSVGRRRPSAADRDRLTTNAAAAVQLTAAEIETYRRQGYLGPFRAFSAAEMELVRRTVYERILPIPTPHCPFGNRIRHLDSRTIWNLARAPEIVGRMASVFGPDLVLWNTNLFDKPPARPGAMEEYPWHQDHYNWPMEPILNISAWLAITPATLENGCVEVIPGSHRQIIPPAIDTNDQFSLRFGGVSSDLKYVDESKKVPLVMQPGEFFLFNERLLHHSNPNFTQARRLGIAIRVTVPLARVGEPFPCLLLNGEDQLGFNRYAEPPIDEPDVAWERGLTHIPDFAFDAAPPGKGWHVPESDGKRRFAWTGLEPESWLEFRAPEPGDQQLLIEFPYVLDQQAVDELQVRVNGERVAHQLEYVDGLFIVRGHVPSAWLPANGKKVRITLQSGQLRRPCDLNSTSNDKRKLGLAVSRVSLRPWTGEAAKAA